MNAAGYSPWILIDYTEAWFGVGVYVVLSEDGNLTYTVQYSADFDVIQPGLGGTRKVTISRTGTTATVTDLGPYGLGHGLTTGDSVIIKGSGSSTLDSITQIAGQGGAFNSGDIGLNIASTPSPTTYTYTVANSGPTADNGNAYVSRFRVFPHGTLAALTARGAGTINYPVRAVRLYVSAYTAGYADMTVLQGSTK